MPFYLETPPTVDLSMHWQTKAYDGLNFVTDFSSFHTHEFKPAHSLFFAKVGKDLT